MEPLLHVKKKGEVIRVKKLWKKLATFSDEMVVVTEGGEHGFRNVNLALVDVVLNDKGIPIAAKPGEPKKTTLCLCITGKSDEELLEEMRK